MPSRPLDDGTFTPRQFPIDPFNPQSSRDLWHLDTSSLPAGDEFSIQPKVILVLGEPPPGAIAPLLRSTLLESSLLILATARSCLIPPNTSPAVVILRLSTPILSSDAAAARLVAVLQWADRVACAWRADKSPPQFQELTEDGTIAGYLSFGSSPLPSRDTSPARNGPDTRLPRSLTPTISLSRSGKRASINSITSLKTSTAGDGKRSSPYAFDAFFNFLPSDLADRQILKQAILVTTVSRPFLTCTLPTPAPPPKRAKRFIIRPPSFPPSPPLTQITPAHIVHIIPPLCTAVIRPLESFCLTFSFHATSSRSALRIAPPSVDMGTPGPPPRPFITTPSALLDVVLITRQWTLAELIVCGALDGRLPTDMSELGFLKDRPENDALLHDITKPSRAWLSGVNDLTLSGSLDIEEVGNSHVGMVAGTAPLPSSSHRASQYSSYAVSEPPHTWQRSPSVDMSRVASSSFASSSSHQPYNPHVLSNDPQPYWDPGQDQQQQSQPEPHEQVQEQQEKAQQQQPYHPSRPPRSPLRSPSRSPSSASSHSPVHSFSYPTSYHFRKRSVSATSLALGAATGSGSGSGSGLEPGIEARSEPGAMLTSGSSSGSVSMSGMGVASGSGIGSPGSGDTVQRRPESTPSSSLSHSLSSPPSPGFFTPPASPSTSPSTSPDIDVAKGHGGSSGSGEGGSSEDATLGSGAGDGDDQELKVVEKAPATTVTGFGKVANVAPAVDVKSHATGALLTPPQGSKKRKGFLAWIKRR